MEYNGRLRRYRTALFLVPFSIVGISVGCSSAPSTLFETGSPAELLVAEEMAMQYLDVHLAPENLDARQHFKPSVISIDELHMAHVRVQQERDKVPVFGGEMIVHLNPDGSLFAVTDTHVRDIPSDIVTTPTMGVEDVVETVLGNYDCVDCLTAPPVADLLILNRPEAGLSEPRLAYRVQLERVDGTELTEMPVVFIDAVTGKELWRYDNLQTAAGTGNGYYYKNVSFTSHLATTGTYVLADIPRNFGTYQFLGSYTAWSVEDLDNTFTDPKHAMPVDVHYVASKTFDYFMTAHGRNGIDGAGGPGYYYAAPNKKVMASVANYGPKYAGAIWDSARVLYGDGNGITFGPAATLDLGAHEMTHGIIQYTAKLIYSGESGALNESIADVFGAMVERAAKGETADTWKVAEESFTPQVPGDARRYIDNPHKASGSFTADDDPDHYSERYTGLLDNGGVHVNSGIGNKAFYLLAKGGSHHLGGSMADIGQPNGIGPDKAAAIWYKALTTYMTSTTTFSGARTATINAATVLHGAGSPEVAAVTQAWKLVGADVPGPPTCALQLCTTKPTGLPIGCDPCVAKVCASRASCCTNEWDSTCVADAVNICGKTCPTCSSGNFTSANIGIIAPNAALNFGPTSSFTVAYWANLQATTAHVLVKGDNNSAEWSIVRDLQNSNLCFRRQGPFTPIACHSTGYGQWHHYVVTHANGTVTMYEDGIQRATGTGQIGAGAMTELKVGNYLQGDLGTNGQFDQLNMWSKALTPAQVTALYLRTSTPASLGSLVGEWKFDEGAGTTVSDSTGYGKTLTLNGAGWSPTCASFACPAETLDVNGDGKVCQPYANCQALLTAKPGTTSGFRMIDPDGPGGKPPFGTWCFMGDEGWGGGWTLLFNYGTSFDKTNPGLRGVDAYLTSDRINAAYSEVPIGSAIMFDTGDGPLSGYTNLGMRVIINPVDPSLVGKTMHYLLNNGTNWPLDNASNSNLVFGSQLGTNCSTWEEYGLAVCGNLQMLLNDDQAGGLPNPFVIGVVPTSNAAGWPQNPGSGTRYWPFNYRVYVR